MMISARQLQSFIMIIASFFLVTRRSHAFLQPSLCTSRSTQRCVFNRDMRAALSYGANLDQQDLMESDMLIAVDANDNVVHDATLSKRRGHEFSTDNPRAILHRAFSFFIFDQQDRMLLTQRASSKITFPNVWTNTCCSHPLRGMSALGYNDEVDNVATDYPQFDGIKHAAIRKLKHELGIQGIQHDRIQFLTRFHYWAADTVTYGQDATPWGEHEIDYILFYKLRDGETLQVDPNPDEVSAYKYVTALELQEMMASSLPASLESKHNGKYLWSPWFCGIMDRGGWTWWDDVKGSLSGKYTNTDITYFDPPDVHYASYNLPTHGRDTGVLQSSAASVESVNK